MAVLVTLLSMWVLPSLVKKMTDGARRYPLVYYSSILKELCIIDFVNDKDSFADIRGNRYPRAEYDSLMPMLNFRQLMMNGTLPDTLEGYPIDPKLLRMKQVVFRQYPSGYNTPERPMGVLLEAMPKRMNIVLPGDYFRMDDAITFIDAKTNQIDEAKSARFTEALKRKGFTFPVQHYWGNPTTRKPYEEGYFCLDSKGELFHLKMVNGRPFVKNTGIGSKLQVKWFSMMEVPDKRFYGFLFGENGETGILESTDEGAGYQFVKMDIAPFDIENDDLTIMGNLLYWTVRVENAQGSTWYALHSDNLEAVSHYHMDAITTLWDDIAPWLFVTSITPQTDKNTYVSVYFGDFSTRAFMLNAVIALLFFFLTRKRYSSRHRSIAAFYLLITGLIGVLTLMFIPPYEKK